MSGKGGLTRASRESDIGRCVQTGGRSYTNSGKENLNISGGSFGDNSYKSPLPVGYPREPLNDITWVLQSLDDESERVWREHREPSQNLPTCSQRYELVAASGKPSIQSRANDQDGRSSKSQFATKAVGKTLASRSSVAKFR